MPRLETGSADSDIMPDGTVVDTAISWFIRLQGSSTRSQDRRDFNTWLAASPMHQVAWRRIQSLGGRIDDVQPDIGLKTLERARDRKQARRSALKTLGAVLVGGSAATWLATRTQTWQAATADYVTAVGERRTVTLDDGTEIVMNTDSAFNVRFDRQNRWVDLVSGEVCITTGKDTAATRGRPFRVRTEFGILRALGTRFLVRLDPEQGWLNVEQGAVEVTAAGMRATAQAGDTMRFDREGVRRQQADLLPSAWLKGMLIVHNMPLSQFLAELSRYRRGFVTCDDAIARLPVSGAYQTKDPDKVLALVAASQGLSLGYRTRFWVVVSKEDRSAYKKMT